MTDANLRDLTGLSDVSRLQNEIADLFDTSVSTLVDIDHQLVELITAPKLESAIPDQSTLQDSTEFSLDVSGYFSDKANGVDISSDLLFSAGLSDGSPLPSWLSIDSTTGVFSVEGAGPDDSDVGDLNIVATATDVDGLEVSDTFKLSIINVNDAPTVAMISDQIAVEDSFFTYTIPSRTFTDVDEDKLSYTVNGTLPDGITFNALTRTFSGTPTNDAVGTHSITVTAEDPSGASVSTSFDLIVGNVNDRPELVSELIGISTTEGSTALNFDTKGYFRDIDGDTLTYTATLSNGEELPDWLDFTGGVFTATSAPADADVGVLSITVTASDTALAVSDTFRLTVNNVNNVPDTDSATLNNAKIDEGDQETIFLTEADVLTGVADLDGSDVLAITALYLQNPSDGSIADIGGGIWAFTPNENFMSVTDVAVRFAVSDGTAISWGTANIEVTPAPEINNLSVENGTTGDGKFVLGFNLNDAEVGDEVLVFVDGVQVGIHDITTSEIAFGSTEIEVTAATPTGSSSVSVAVLDSAGNIIQYADEVAAIDVDNMTWS